MTAHDVYTFIKYAVRPQSIFSISAALGTESLPLLEQLVQSGTVKTAPGYDWTYIV